VEYNGDDVMSMPQHDGSVIRLRKTHPDYDPTDRVKTLVAHHAAKEEVVTGLLYLDPNSEDLHAHLNTVEAPFNKLLEKELCPGGYGEDQRCFAVISQANTVLPPQLMMACFE